MKPLSQRLACFYLLFTINKCLFFFRFRFALPLFSDLDLHVFGGMELLETHTGVL